VNCLPPNPRCVVLAAAGISGCIRKIVVEEGGKKHLWRGFQPALMSATLYGPVRTLAMIPLAFARMSVLGPDDTLPQRVTNTVATSVISALFISTLIYPFEYARTIAAVDFPKVVGAFGGAAASSASLASASASASASATASAVAASTSAGSVVAGAALTAGSVSANTAPRQFTGMADIWRVTRAASGWRGMYRGYWVNVLSLTVQNTARLLSLDAVRWWSNQTPEMIELLSRHPLTGVVQ
jgi:hypothetical protein